MLIDADDGLTLTDATCGIELAFVVPVATLDRPPKTALTLRVPRYATSWKPYLVDGVRPVTVHVIVLPIPLPASGVLHVPLVTFAAEPQVMGETAKRTSYDAGLPVPSSICVKVRVAVVSATDLTARSVTLPALVALIC